MNIVATQYTLKYKSLEIYLSGCDGICGNSCHNFELRDFRLGENYKNQIDNILNKISDFNNLIQSIWILGGEPLLQNKDELIDLLKILKKTNRGIWLWTRFEINEIPEEIKNLCNYIKTGMYLEKFKTDKNIQYGIQLSTKNQNIYKLR